MYSSAGALMKLGGSVGVGSAVHTMHTQPAGKKDSRSIQVSGCAPPKLNTTTF